MRSRAAPAERHDGTHGGLGDPGTGLRLPSGRADGQNGSASDSAVHQEGNHEHDHQAKPADSTKQ